MTTVVGVDPSLAGTGLCTWRDGRFYVDTIVTPAGMPAPERHHRIVSRLLRMADGPTIYIVEQRIDITPRAELVDGKAKVTGGMRGNSTLDLAELRGVINYGIYRTGHQRVEIHPSTLKLWATGNGHASKQAMMVAARGRLGHLAHVRDDNAADALWLCVAGLHHYGVQLWRPPVKNLRALAGPDWPPFTIGDCR